MASEPQAGGLPLWYEPLEEGIKAARTSRYPIVVVDSVRYPMSNDELVLISESSGLRLVDYRCEVLGSSPVFGAHDRHSLTEWLVRAARDSGGIIVCNTDAVIATWPSPERTYFFREILRQEIYAQDEGRTRGVLVLVSSFANYVDPEWLKAQRGGSGLAII